MLRKGRVVAIPTDALYTLVADPFNLRAVSRVFLAKGRDLHRSLPLLISDSLMAEELARETEPRRASAYFLSNALIVGARIMARQLNPERFYTHEMVEAIAGRMNRRKMSEQGRDGNSQTEGE